MDNEYEIVSMLKEDDGVLISQLIDNDFKKEVLKEILTVVRFANAIKV